MKSKRIAVIGGGVSGLATSAILAAAGQRVTLLEQNEWLGGKSRRIEILGQRIDTGPSLITFPQILEQVIERYERLIGSPVCSEDRLSMLKLPEVGRYFFRDNAVELPVPENHAWHTAWDRFASKRETDEAAIQSLLTNPISRPSALLSAMRLVIAWGGRINAASYLAGLRWLPRELREIIAIHSLNAGLAPSKTLTLYTSLPAIMARQGVMVPHGGVFEIPLLMAKLARDAGAEIRTGIRVSKIEPLKGTVQIYIGDETQEFDWVVLAADSPHLDPERNVNSEAKMSCSGVAIFGVLKADRRWDVVNHSVILPDNPEQLDESLDKRVWPHQTMAFVNYYPAGEIYPNQRDVVAILLTAPADGSVVDLGHSTLQSELERIRNQLGLANHIFDDLDAYQILDPAYFGEWGGHSGALYGEARGLLRSGPFHKPKRRNRAGTLWRVGSAVHPGGGIPAVLGGVLMTTELMLKELDGRS